MFINKLHQNWITKKLQDRTLSGVQSLDGGWKK